MENFEKLPLSIGLEPTNSVYDLEVQKEIVQALSKGNAHYRIPEKGTGDYVADVKNAIDGIDRREKTIFAITVHATISTNSSEQFFLAKWVLMTLDILSSHFGNDNIMTTDLICTGHIYHLYSLIIPISCDGTLNVSVFQESGTFRMFKRRFNQQMIELLGI